MADGARPVGPRPGTRRHHALASLTAALLAVAVLGGTEAASQVAVDFPAPVIAPVLAQDAESPLVAVTSFFRQPDVTELRMVVRFADGWRVPATGRYRVAVHIGQPEAEQLRAYLLVVDGFETGGIDSGQAGQWVSLGPSPAESDPAGEVRITLPTEDFGPNELVWVRVTYDPPEGAAEEFTSPLFSLRSVLGELSPTLQPAPLAWGSTDQPPAAPLESPAPPTLSFDGTTLVLSYSEEPPADLDGIGVDKVVDVIRIAADFTLAGQAPYLIAIDHQTQVVSLLDGRQPIPAEVAGVGDWLESGIPVLGVEAGSQLRLDLSSVLSSFAIERLDDAVAVGVARSITLKGAGGVIRSEGPTATLSWFEGFGGPAPVPVEPDVPALLTSSPGRTVGDLVVPFAAGLAGLLVLGAIVFRFLDRRRTAALIGPVFIERTGTAEVTVDEQADLDRLTGDMFRDVLDPVARWDDDVPGGELSDGSSGSGATSDASGVDDGSAVGRGSAGVHAAAATDDGLALGRGSAGVHAAAARDDGVETGDEVGSGGGSPADPAGPTARHADDQMRGEGSDGENRLRDDADG